jgi:hypothetical protein
MTDGLVNPAAGDDREDDAASADINITARGGRRVLEALYLELRELAKQNGLKVEYKLSLTNPADHQDS